MSTDHMDDSNKGLAVAVIGVAGRFPGANDVEALWANLRAGRESITRFTDEELRAAGVPEAVLRSPGYVKAAPVLDDIERFDADFFGYTPTEARLMDPQQRLFLECAWEALEAAGYDPGRRPEAVGPIGVFAGARVSPYLLHLAANRAAIRPEERIFVELGNGAGSLATRVSYKLDLRGPAYALETACSTGLAAVHLACQSLLLGECRMALAGAASIEVPQRAGYVHDEGGMLSPDGRCRPFDAAAGGTVFGSGVGVVVLKRLADALDDGDRVLAVVRGAAVNNDGAHKASYTAPGVEGQTAVILEALACAGVEADTIGYLEAHGTGTILGDPIEIRAITNAWRASTAARGFCRLGSIKGNVGHLNVAAGIAGFIKAVLAVERGEIPPTLHVERPNPHIDLAASPFVLDGALQPWTGPSPRRAAVSAFGFGGTNAHAILEEAPPPLPSAPSQRPLRLLLWSGRSEEAVEAIGSRLAAWLGEHPAAPLADVAFTLDVGRRAFSHRRALVAGDAAEAARAIADHGGVLAGTLAAAEPPVAFLFPGQGSQHVGMARVIYGAEPVFRAELDRTAEILKPLVGADLRELIFAAPQHTEEAGRRLMQTALAQPALFAVEHALAKLWMSWGVRPAAMLGHSVGEYVAACLAGVFSVEDALELVAARGRLVQARPPGAMLAVPLGEAALRQILDGAGVDVAAVNGPSQCVVSGPAEAIEALSARLAARGVEGQRLRTSHAFHSAMMDEAVAPLAALVRRMRLRAPSIPFVSNVTGTWITEAEATDPGYWARHLRAPVRFGDGVARLLEDPGRVLLEVGPGQALAGIARQQPAARGRAVISSLPSPQEERSDYAALLGAVGRLWTAGAPIDAEARFSGERRRRVALPTYPFERRRYWVDPAEETGGGQAARGPGGKAADVADWFHVQAWRKAPPPRVTGEGAPRRVALFEDGACLAEALAGRLARAGHEVIRVRPGDGFAREGDGRYVIDAARAADYVRLLDDLRGAGRGPDLIVHGFSLAAVQHDQPASAARFRLAQRVGYESLVGLAQALARDATRPARILVVTDRLHDLDGERRALPDKAPLQAACRVIPQEQAHIACRLVDVDLDAGADSLAAAIESELLGTAIEPTVVLRGTRRFVPAYAPVRLGPAAPGAIREGGAYLITGGLGAVGLLIAEHLAAVHKGRLALVGRTALPAREAWDAWIAAHGPEDATSRRILRVRAMEAQGAEVLLLAADVADAAQVREAVAAARARFGALDGVIHAAGLTRGELVYRALTESGREDAEAQFGPKVYGTLALAEAIAGMDVGFVLLVSSSASVLGGLAHLTYAAANQFLDAFARAREGAGGTRWIAASFDPWPAETRHSDLRTALDRYAMTAAEATDVVDRLVASGIGGHVIAITGDLVERVRLWVEREVAPTRRAVEEARPRRARTAFAAPEGEIERAVAAAWKELLGVEQVGRDDDFFELGGHSLLATQLRNQLFGSFQVELPLRALFETPTVAGVARLIEAERARAAASASDREEEQQPIAARLRAAFPTDRAGLVERYLRRLITRRLGAAAIGQGGSLAGLDHKLVFAELENDLKRDLKLQIFPHEVREHPSLSSLAAYLVTELDRHANANALATDAPLAAHPLRPFRAPGGAPPPSLARKNPPMAFVHSSPRAGSTLLRVMLAGHPRLFCPPELNLLFFDDMRQWRDLVGFGHALEWTEGGLQWAFMELLGLDSAAGARLVDELVARNESAAGVFGRIQELAGSRLLVDKTPSYSLDPETLARSEALFDGAKYVYLYRHPLAVMESIVRTRMHRLFSASLFGAQEMDPFLVAEVVWALSNRTLLAFFDGVDAGRVHRVRYEELVAEPERVMRGLCAFLDVPWDERVIAPYDGRRERMMGGLGDPNIMLHKTIERELGDAWRKIEWPRPLDATTRALAERLGYELPAPPAAAATDARQLLDNLDQLSDEQVAALLAEMAPEEAK